MASTGPRSYRKEVHAARQDGRTLTFGAGDVVVIPAGVAHRNVGQSGRLAVVGAYPGRADWDVGRGLPDEYDAVARAAGAVSPDVADPVYGGDGWLRRLWPADVVVT